MKLTWKRGVVLWTLIGVLAWSLEPVWAQNATLSPAWERQTAVEEETCPEVRVGMGLATPVEGAVVVQPNVANSASDITTKMPAPNLQAILPAFGAPVVDGVMELALGLWLPLLLGLGVWWLLNKKAPLALGKDHEPGLEVISPNQPRQFFALGDKYLSLDKITNRQEWGELRLSANLNKVQLSIRRFGYMLEDKNFRNALLVNRRRMRRTLLTEGDVLDLGDLTLLYRDSRSTVGYRPSLASGEGKVGIRFNTPRGPVKKGTPMIIPEAAPNRVFFVTKNLVYVGRSQSCDLSLRSTEVAFRHAKIERVGGRFKLTDLALAGNTFVNNRRVEQRYLRDGDELAIDTIRFRFALSNRTIAESVLTPRNNGESGDSAENVEVEEVNENQPSRPVKKESRPPKPERRKGRRGKERAAQTPEDITDVEVEGDGSTTENGED